MAAWARGVVPTSKIHLIPNPVRVEPTPDDAPPALASLIDERAIVAVGRMSPEKGFDLLIDAFARVHAGRPEWRLVILGEGTERPRLEAQIKRLGLRAAVELPGTVPDPAEAFRRAGIFALSSRIEGFPNALLEAMAAGLPVVAADCPYGPAEIVQDEWNGMLVPVGNADALATGLLRLIDDPELRARLGARATSVAEAYSPEKIMGSWNRVVADACARRPRAPVPGGQR